MSILMRCLKYEAVLAVQRSLDCNVFFYLTLRRKNYKLHSDINTLSKNIIYKYKKKKSHNGNTEMLTPLPIIDSHK